MPNRFLQKFEPTQNVERLLVVLLLLIFLIEGNVALCHMSATGDETHYLGMGRYLLKYQRWDLDDTLLQPPLSYYLHSIPLLFLSINDHLYGIPDLNARGRAIMESYPDDRVLMLAPSSHFAPGNWAGLSGVLLGQTGLWQPWRFAGSLFICLPSNHYWKCRADNAGSLPGRFFHFDYVPFLALSEFSIVHAVFDDRRSPWADAFVEI